MNKQQVAWAKQHDWFVKSDMVTNSPLADEYLVTCRGILIPISPFGEIEENIKQFHDIQALRAWAGY